MLNEVPENKFLADAAVVLPHTPLFQFLDARDFAVFSTTCKAARNMTAGTRKKQALEHLLVANAKNEKGLINKILTSWPDLLLEPSILSLSMIFCMENLNNRIINSRPTLLQKLDLLLTAVVYGNEKWTKEIVTRFPELLLDSSATVKDISGKTITGQTPLQALICAGDVDMLRMIETVLQQRLQSGQNLSFAPKLEIRRQLATIYPDGDIDSVETAQKTIAQEFKTSTLYNIFEAINNATDEQVEYELKTPGLQNADSLLNTALHNFRAQFATTANSEQIFNPFYLLNAFKFYDEKFDNFTGNKDEQWNRRNLFWQQVIGYIQRHLPACYLQAFARGIYDIVDKGVKLKRDFEFHNNKGFYMRGVDGDLNNLGYKWGGGWLGGMHGVVWGGPIGASMPGGALAVAKGVPGAAAMFAASFQNYCEQKNQVWRTYAASVTISATSELPTDTRCVFA